MSLKLRPVHGAVWLSAVLCGALLISISGRECAAQSSSRALPRVGTIKDFPATGLMTGCGNFYFYPARLTRSAADAYVFVARSDGGDAWMNLNGRDVRLRQIKSPARGNGFPRRFNYRFGETRISVTIENFKGPEASAPDGDPMFQMRIIVRRRQAVRIVRADGSADC